MGKEGGCMKMCQWCGCTTFKQTQLREVYFNIDNGNFEDIAIDWLEDKSAIICSDCGRQYEFDGRDIYEVGGSI